MDYYFSITKWPSMAMEIIIIIIIWLVVWNIWIIFHILGMSSSQLTNSFQRGWNHQLEYISRTNCLITMIYHVCFSTEIRNH